MRDYVRLTGVLLIVCIVAALVLGVTNAVTYEKIVEQAQKADDEARKEVLPLANEFSRFDENRIEEILKKDDYAIIEEIFEGKASDELVGYTIKTIPKGYGGEIEIIVGINNEGSITGIKVGNNTETPGLGKNAATPWFQEQFEGMHWDDDIAVIKNGIPEGNEVLSIAGATMTSDAVAEGVNIALNLAKELIGI